MFARQFGKKISGGFPFQGGIGGEHQFAYFALRQPFIEHIQPQFRRAYAIKRGNMPHEHKIDTLIIGGLFKGKHIRRRFDHADNAVIAQGIGANQADVVITQIAAMTAVLHFIQRHANRAG